MVMSVISNYICRGIIIEFMVNPHVEVGEIISGNVFLTLFLLHSVHYGQCRDRDDIYPRASDADCECRLVFYDRSGDKGICTQQPQSKTTMKFLEVGTLHRDIRDRGYPAAITRRESRLVEINPADSRYIER